MFCPKCGTENNENAVFCEKCGAKLNDKSENKKTNKEHIQDEDKVKGKEQFQETEEKEFIDFKEKKPISFQKKILIGLIIAVSAILLVVNMKLTKCTNPEHVALTYFENVAKGDWNKVYDYFDLPESQFVSRSMFKKAMKDTDKIECSNYQIKINNSVEDAMNDMFNEEDDNSDVDEDSSEDISKVVTIEYVKKGNSGKKSNCNIQLVKVKKKKWLFYDNWKVVPKDMVIDNYTIRTVTGVNVEIDGNKLDAGYKKNKKEDTQSIESDYDVYTIPAIFKGKHTLKISGKLIDTFKDEIECDQYGSKQYIYTDVEVKKDLKKEIKDNTSQVVKDIYNKAVDNVDFDDLSLKYGFSKDNKNELKNDYNNLVNNLDKTSFTKKIKVKKLSLKEYRVKDEQTKVDSGLISVTIKYEFRYDGEFIKEKSEGKRETKKENGTLEGNITYQYKDGKWYISKMYLDRIYMYY